jgi:2-phosphosulfolactate phosphatase
MSGTLVYARGMTKIHVLLKKEELDGERLQGKIVVVLDVLFATSTIVAALASGATEVLPALDGEAATAAARDLPAGSFVLSGELNANTLPGFAHPMPLALLEHGVSGKALVYSTTNGTVALAKAREAEQVFAAALLNGEALVERVERAAHGKTVVLVCAGSGGTFNLEDFYGAGYLVSLFARANAQHDFSDAAIAARRLHDSSDAFACLAEGRIGRLMLQRGLEREIRYAAQKSILDAVPVLRESRLTLD